MRSSQSTPTQPHTMTLITVPLIASLLVRDSYQFVFPDTFDSVGRLRERTEDNEVEPLIRSCPGGEDYCELPPSYPANKIARALHKIDNSLMRSLLNRTIDSAEIGAEISFRSRQSSESDYERVCSSSKEFIQPRQAKNKPGELRARSVQVREGRTSKLPRGVPLQ